MGGGMVYNLKRTSQLFFLTLALAGCRKEEAVKVNLPDPAITGFAPTSGQIGTVVTITGANFSKAVESNTVTFNGTEAQITSAAANEIIVTVPNAATTGPISVNVNGAKTPAQSRTEFIVNP
jgi:hypothetical protein